EGILTAMFRNELKVTAFVLIALLAAAGFGAGILAQQAPADRQPNSPRVATVGRNASAPRSETYRLPGVITLAPDTLSVVSAPIACRVDKVLVDLGSAVKKGDPVLEVFSTNLAAAKNDYETAISQHARDKKTLDYKAPLAESNTLPRKELIEDQNDEAK